MTLKEAFASRVAIRQTSVASVMESAVYATPSLRSSLGENPYLTESGWFKLYKRFKLTPADAVILCSRPLSAAQRKFVIAEEKRERPLVAMLEFNLLSVLEMEQLSRSNALKARVASKLLEQIPDSEGPLLREVSLRVGGVPQLRWLASASDVEEESARELLERFSSWAPVKDYSKRSFYLTQILERFPSLVGTFASSDHEALRLVAAGSRFLTDVKLQGKVAGLSLTGASDVEERKYTLLALVNNPVVGLDFTKEVKALIGRTGSHLSDVLLSIESRAEKKRDAVTEPYSEVEDLEALHWLFNRSVPSEFKPQGRFGDLALIALNPHLNKKFRTRAASELSTWAAIEALGVERSKKFWESFTGLFPEFKEYQPESFDLSVDPGSKISEWSHMSFADNVQGYDDKVESWPLVYFSYYNDDYTWMHVGEFLSSRLGARFEAWEVFFSLLDEFTGTLSELADTAASL